MEIFFLLWLFIWSGYNTTHFDYNTNSFNKWRSLFPLVGLLSVLSTSFIFESFSPLGLITIYFLIGLVTAIFNHPHVLISLWWAGMFGSTILFLTAITHTDNPIWYIYLIMNINWVISSIISLGLMAYFLTRPGIIKSISIKSLFSFGFRPFEGWLDVIKENNILGFIGTRPTGLARYAAISSLVMLSLFITYQSYYWFIAFIMFTFILLFSKGRTEIVAFVVSMGFILFFSQNLLILLLLIYLIILGISYTIVFGKVIYIIPQSKEEVSKLSKEDIIQSNKTVKKSLLTLGGRTVGVWPQAISFIKKKPLFGYGFGIQQYLLKGWLDKPTTVDSTILNALLQTGIVGTTFFITPIILVILMASQLLISGNHSLMLLEACSIGIFILIRGITQSFSGYSSDWLFLIPLIAYIQVMFIK